MGTDPASFGPCGQCVRTDKHTHIFPLVGEFRQCEHGYHHPPWSHSCDGCYCLPCPWDGLRHEFSSKYIPEKGKYFDICKKCGRNKHE